MTADLLERVVEAPGDLTRYAVYADWLQTQGDPRGELMTIQLALAKTTDTGRYVQLQAAERALLPQVVVRTFGPELGAALSPTFRLGFVNSVNVRSDVDLERLTTEPACRLLQKAQLKLPEGPAERAVEVLSRVPSLTRLEVEGHRPTNLPLLPVLLAQLESLTFLRVEAFGDTEWLTRCTRLKALSVRQVDRSESLGVTLRRNVWPALTRVELDVSGVSADDLAPLVARGVSRLALDVDEVLRLVKRPGLEKLEVLELLGEVFTEHVESLLPLPPRLQLMFHQGQVSSEAMKRLRARFKGVAPGGTRIYQVDEVAGDQARALRRREAREREQSSGVDDE